MQTIAEDFATLSTPRVVDLEVPGSSTSSTEDGADVVTDDGLSESGDEANSDQSAASNARSTFWCGMSKKTVEKYVPVVVSVSIGAYFGVGVRVLLTEFAKALYTSQTELLELLGFSYFLPNVVGCFVMGVAGRLKPVLRNQYNTLLTGVTTGFCGCCTTFASWDLAAALMFVHGRWLNAILVLCVQVASAMVSLRLGAHIGEGVVHYFTLQQYPFRKPPVDLPHLKVDLERNISHFREIKLQSFGQLVALRVRATEESLVTARDSCTELISEIAQVEHDQHPVHHNERAWVWTGLLMTAVLWVLPFIGFANYPSSRLLSLCFGPFGALLRYFLSLRNSQPQWKHFPFYTFLPNVAASCLSCVMEIVSSITSQDGGATYRTFVLFGEGGILVGFLGSLSTVSTWVNELDALSSRRVYWAYRYGLASVIVSQLASVFILGMFDIYGNAPLV
ncbi:hypothetical protein BBJ28_00011303 [Nothophytophthora sp. Chile5]|nr:hypothetical protein BBJ28_00011303 [Nothophytophthora sp. Chile5]